MGAGPYGGEHRGRDVALDPLLAGILNRVGPRAPLAEDDERTEIVLEVEGGRKGNRHDLSQLARDPEVSGVEVILGAVGEGERSRRWIELVIGKIDPLAIRSDDNQAVPTVRHHGPDGNPGERISIKARVLSLDDDRRVQAVLGDEPLPALLKVNEREVRQERPRHALRGEEVRLSRFGVERDEPPIRREDDARALIRFVAGRSLDDAALEGLLGEPVRPEDLKLAESRPRLGPSIAHRRVDHDLSLVSSGHMRIFPGQVHPTGQSRKSIRDLSFIHQ